MRAVFYFLLCSGLTIHGAVFRVANDAKVNQWLVTQVGSPGASVATQIAMTIWLRDVRAGGLYPGKILRKNLFCGNVDTPHNNLGAVQQPIISDIGSADDSNLSPPTLGGNWTYKETGSGGGLRPTAANGYIDTGVIPSAVFSSITNAHLSLYVTTGVNETCSPLACYPNLTDSSRICALYVSNGGTPTSYSWLFSAGSPGPASVADSLGVGYYIGTSQVGSNSLWKAGVLKARGASGGALPAALSIYVFAMHAESPASLNYCTHTFGSYEIGTSFSDADAAVSQAAEQRFQTSLSRQR